MSEKRNSFTADILNAIRGVCMGCADVVPGVSGGTVALILGIYERLVTAISHLDGSLISQLRRREWSKSAEHCDLRFLMTLGVGIASGIVGMSLLVNKLLANDVARSITFAAFCGMILASACLITSLIRPSSVQQCIRCVCVGLIGVAFAYWVSTLTASGPGAEPSYVYVFVCGTVAICAMILPGISGALILLVLGIYGHLTEVPHNLLHGEHVGKSVLMTLVFGCGCLTGLIGFSKVLRWLLEHHHATTMALLCGFMVGALRKLWPFQEDMTPDIPKFKEKLFEVRWPEQIDGTVIAVTFAAFLAAGLVLAVHRIARPGKG